MALRREGETGREGKTARLGGTGPGLQELAGLTKADCCCCLYCSAQVADYRLYSPGICWRANVEQRK
jgi:hypothetical protein